MFFELWRRRWTAPADEEMGAIGLTTFNISHDGINTNNNTSAANPIISSQTTWLDYTDSKISRDDHIRAIATTSTDTVLVHYQSRKEGLTPAEACGREKLVGANIMSVREKRPWWKLLLASIANPFNGLLGALMVLAVATPDRNWVNFGIIVLMLSLSCLMRFSQEFRSSLAAIKLQLGVERLIQVRRPRDRMLLGSTSLEDHVDFKKLVPGEIVMLNPGDNVPADCLLLETSRLQISQSSLTGESMPQEKTAGAVSEKCDKAIFDLPNIAFMGTSVVSGTGVAIVIATGDRAYIASIREQLERKQPKSAFDAGIERVSYLLIGFMLVMVAVVLIIRGSLSHDWAHAAQFSMTVAVGIVPEMLPTIINANLVRGARLLKRKGMLVKPLAAVQNLGAMTILCSDKTGTLTKDEMTLATAEDCSGKESEMVLKMAYTNAFYQKGKKNQIDAAIIRKQDQRGNNVMMLLGGLIMEIPFEFEKRRSSVVIDSPEVHGPWLICKGAFEEVINLCTQMQVGKKTITLGSVSRQTLFAKVHALNDDGYRVLGVATRVLTGPVNQDMSDDELCKDMVFQGILTLLDPPRDDAAEAIASLQTLGVQVKVLTGDNARIATKLCRTLNIHGIQDAQGGVMSFTGPELEQMSPEDFSTAVHQATVLAKLTPSQKGDVVRALKASGNVLGMLGDGMNDCIALSVADVGISVKNAVTAAQDCADVILTEKCLNIIVSGVRTGRLVHGNSMKYIKMVTSSNFGNVLSIVVASSWLPYQPMTPTQILVQNLLYDFSQMAIPWDTMDESYLSLPHGWSVLDLLRFIVCLGPTSSVIDITTFCLGWFFYHVRTTAQVIGVEMVNTHWFLQGLLTQVLIVHVLRTAGVPFLRSRSSKVVACATVTIMGLGIALPYIAPIARVMGMVRPADSFIGFLVAELVVYCGMVQVVKMLYVRKFGVWI